MNGIPDTQSVPQLDTLLDTHGLRSESVHLKRAHTTGGEPMIACELAGLVEMSETHQVRIPRVYGLARDRGVLCLVMDRVRAGSGSRGAYREAGGMLARMHTVTERETAGLDYDNYIGAGIQNNGWMDVWSDFFAERRIKPQIRTARSKGLLDGRDEKAADRLCARLSELLPDNEPMSLLHGDLWAGNLLTDADGRAWFIDPAVYYGHREADIAMTRLFGGVPTAFYEAYEEEWPLTAGYPKREPIYNLYHMLNHLNIFGTSYLGSVRSILKPFSDV